MSLSITQGRKAGELRDGIIYDVFYIKKLYAGLQQIHYFPTDLSLDLDDVKSILKPRLANVESKAGKKVFYHC